jgi:hypothetical protein
MEPTWTLTGKSGHQYTFTVYAKTALLPEDGGIYLLAYAHPRGHLAGFHVTPLIMGAAKDLRSAVSGLQGRECLARECWNYTLILPLDHPKQRTVCLIDLRAANPTSC